MVLVEPVVVRPASPVVASQQITASVVERVHRQHLEQRVHQQETMEQMAHRSLVAPEVMDEQTTERMVAALLPVLLRVVVVD